MNKILTYKPLLKSAILFALLLMLQAGWSALNGQTIQNVDYDVAGTFTYTVPAGITELVVECWGGGGGGSAAKGLLLTTLPLGSPGSGGGGGAHAHSVIKVTPGQQLTFVIGAGGAGGTNPYSNADAEGKKGGNTSVYDANGKLLVSAEGGNGGRYFSKPDGGSKGGIGGRYQASKGDVIHPGGNGADASILSGQEYAGGGGGAAGRTHGGYNANGMTAGPAGTCYCGIPGAGGVGRNTTGNGNPGINTQNVNRGVKYAGGGGGGGFDSEWGMADGGKGADGHIRVKEQIDIGEITGGNSMEVGETLQLIAPVSGGTWRSSLPGIAIVDAQTGLVTALQQGTTVISYNLGNFLTEQSTQILLHVYPVGGSMEITGDLFYCEDGSQNINLSASTSLTGTYLWSWTGPNGFEENSPGFTLPAIYENGGFYTVTAVRYAEGNDGMNLIVNGDFESGNIGFSSDYTYNQWSQSPGIYNVDKTFIYNNINSPCSDNTSGNGNYFGLRGDNTANTVWRQTVSVESGSKYELSFYMTSTQDYNVQVMPAEIDLRVLFNGVAAGNLISITSSRACEGWKKYRVEWTSEVSDNVAIEIKLDKNMGPDYFIGLDDIAMHKLFEGENSVITQDVEVVVGSAINPELSIISVPSPPVGGQTNKFIANTSAVGLNPTYKWYVNGVEAQSGSSLSFSSDDLVAGDVVKCEVLIDAANFECIEIPETGLVAEIVVQAAEGEARNLWVGTVNDKWYTVDNWSLRKVPLHDEDIEFATEHNYFHSANRDLVISKPEVDEGGSVEGEGNPDWSNPLSEIANYINHSDKKLIIASAAKLEITNDIDTQGGNKITIQSAAGEPTGTLLITKAGTDDSTMPLATVEFYSKASINASASTGSKYHWQYFGIPVQSITASPTFAGAFVRQYDESLQTTEPGKQWDALENKSTMEPFFGYEITQNAPKLYSIEGRLVRRNFSLVLSRTTGSYYQGQHILSNPYTAAMEIEHISFGDALEKTVYVYNTGSYNDWNSGVTDWESPGSYIAIPKNQAGYLGITQIPPMDGFLVRVLGEPSSSDVDRTISYSYSNLVGNTTLMRSASSQQADKVSVIASLTGAHSTDRIWLFHEDNCTPAFDNGWDGPKMLASSGAQLFANINGELYQVSSTNNLDGVSLGVIADERDRDYTLTLELKNIYPQYLTLWLHDLTTGAKLELKHGENKYRFTMQSNESNTDRFLIVAQEKPQLPQLPHTYGISLKVKDNTLMVQNHNKNSGTITIVDASGRVIINRHPIESLGISTLPFALPTGVYIATSVTDGRIEVKKFVK